MSLGDVIDIAIDLMLKEKFAPSESHRPMDPGEMEIKSLISRLTCGDSEESKKATWSISNLSRHPINRRTIIKESALPILVRFLKDKSDSRVVDVLRLLTNLSQTTVYRKEILATESLSLVVVLMRTGKTQFTEQSMEFIANMCLNRQAKESLIREKGLLEILLTYLRKTNDRGRSHVVRALVQLSSVPSVATSLLKMNAIKVFVDVLMTTDNPNIKAWVAELIYNLSLDTKMLHRFGSVCVWQMIDLLDRSDLVCKVWALKALGNLTHRQQLRRNVMRQGGIPLITSLLKNDNELCVDEAAHCLANMTQDSEKVNPCIRKGVIHKLVKLLETKSLDALTTVANISEVKEQRLMLLQAGVIPLLVQFLRTDDPDENHKLATLRCLAHLSDVDVSISWFLEKSVVSRIVHSLRSECLISCSYAAHIIKNIAESPQGIREVVEAGAVWLLIGLLRKKSDTAVLSAVKALSVLSSNRNARSLITQYDGISILLALLKDSTDETRVYTAKTLYDLSSNMDVQHVVVNEGGIQTLIGMLSSQNFEVRENALCLLIRLGLSKKHWSAIKEGGGVGLMLKQLLVSELRDTVGVCQSFVKFFNSVIFLVIKGQFGAE